MLTIIKRSLLGALAGYVIYASIACIDIAIHYFVYGHTPFESFEVWVLPLMAPSLLWIWKEVPEVPLEFSLLMLCGGLLLVAGVVWANLNKWTD